MLDPTQRQWLTGRRVEVANVKVLLLSQYLQPARALGGLDKEGLRDNLGSEKSQTNLDWNWDSAT